MAAGSNTFANTCVSTRSGNGMATGNSHGGCAAVPDNSAVGPTMDGLKHKVRISVDWSRDEQSLLEELIARYASDSKPTLYSRIARQLQDKTARDVAIRCRWMANKEKGKQRKDDNISARKQKDKRVQERVMDPQATNRANGLPYAQSSNSMDSDNGFSYKAIGGVYGLLVEQNAKALDQISVNFTNYKAHENISLLCQTRKNINAILNSSLNNMPEKIKQMPPLPVKLNEELANSILPHSSMHIFL